MMNIKKITINILAILCFMATSLSLHAAGGGGGATTKLSYIVDKVESVMTKEKLEKIYPYPYVIGEKDEEIDVWPLSRQEVTGVHLIGYVYESIDFSSIPGFMGIPYNLLIAIDNSGVFIDVQVLYHREPMFVAGIGEQPMIDFASQYKDLSLMQNIKFGVKQGKKRTSDTKNIYLDGVSGATASIRILNQTLLSSGLKVARAKLGFGSSKDPDLIAKIDNDVFEEKSWDELLESGLIHKHTLINKEVEALFIDTVSEGRDEEAIENPNDKFIDLYVMDLAIPTIGRNLLTQQSWEFLQENLKGNDHAILAVSSGRYSFVHENFTRGNISDRLILRQSGLPVEMRDLDFNERLDLFDPEYKIKLPQTLSDADWMVFRIIGPAGLDISQALEFELSITRGDKEAYLTPTTKSVQFKYIIPNDYYFEPESGNKTWHSIWTDRLGDITALILGLIVLSVVLLKPKLLTQHPRHFKIFRASYLTFCLFFIGWHAQGQLSIVNITGAIQSLMAGGGLNFFLYDPMTTILWVFVIVTFFIWGRGTFCGWLCPFGAFQELVTNIFSKLKLSQFEPSAKLDGHLKKVKYVVLFSIIAAAFLSPTWADRLVEIEPFKTSITFFFIRFWPFTLWAVAMVLLSIFVFKGYCRYVCPLGAAMALLGKFRIFNWLQRRKECGSPCQLCKNACQYQSIKKSGEIDYQECFQCLDCVVIHDNDTLCAPLIIDKRNKASAVKIMEAA